VPLREPLKAVHDALVRAHDHLQAVALAEVLHPVGAKGHQAGAAGAGLDALGSARGARGGVGWG